MVAIVEQAGDCAIRVGGGSASSERDRGWASETSILGGRVRHGGRKAGRWADGGEGGRGDGEKGDILKAVGCKIGVQDQFKYAVRLGFIIPSPSMTSLSCRL